jgi:hypothetical protein
VQKCDSCISVHLSDICNDLRTIKHNFIEFSFEVFWKNLLVQFSLQSKEKDGHIPWDLHVFFKHLICILLNTYWVENVPKEVIEKNEALVCHHMTQESINWVINFCIGSSCWTLWDQLKFHKYQCKRTSNLHKNPIMNP